MIIRNLLPSAFHSTLTIATDYFHCPNWLTQRQYNVILVDWLNGAGPYDFFYPLAVVNTEVVGRQIAVLLYQLLSTYALSPSSIHYVGHSLGAQTAHFFADYFKKISGGMRINKITGMANDPKHRRT